MPTLLAMSRRRKLTAKQRLFVVHYLGTWNATEAASRAGYKGTRNTLRVTGQDNLLVPAIKQAIADELERQTMGPEEVLSRLSMMARGTLDPFLVSDPDTGEVVVDLTTESARAHMQLVKKVEQTVVRTLEDGSKVLKTKLEIHDPKVALDSIAKAHGMFRQRVEISGPEGAPIAIDWSKYSDEELRAIAELRKKGKTGGGEG